MGCIELDAIEKIKKLGGENIMETCKEPAGVADEETSCCRMLAPSLIAVMVECSAASGLTIFRNKRANHGPLR